MINTPQGSIASDVQQVEDLNDPDIDQQPIISDMNNLNLDDINFSSNAARDRYFDIFHWKTSQSSLSLSTFIFCSFWLNIKKKERNEIKTIKQTNN